MNPADARREQRLHRFFEITLLLKALFAVGEIVAAIGVYVVPLDTGRRFCRRGYQRRAGERTRMISSPPIWRLGANLSVGTQHFVAFYLLSHGAVKLWVIIGLMRERLWYYPVALVLFTLFIIYQIHRYMLTHSVSLAADHHRSISLFSG